MEKSSMVIYSMHTPCNNLYFHEKKNEMRENYVPYLLLEHYDSSHDNIAAMTK